MNENLQIDPSMLDEEWLQQPLLFDRAATEAADLQEEVDELKNDIKEAREKLEWLIADRSLYFRKAFKEEGYDKAPAQGVVDDWVIKQVEVQTAKEEIHTTQVKLSKAENNLLRANNTVKAFEQRKVTLENLCKLHGMNYFSVPNPGHMLNGGKRVLEAKEQKIESNSKAATEGLNQKKKSRKTKEEVLDKIKNPDTKEAAKKAIEAEEQQEPKVYEGSNISTTPKRGRRRRR